MDIEEIPLVEAAEIQPPRFLAGLALNKKPLMSASVKKDLRPLPILCR